MAANKGLLREILEDLPMLYRESPQGVTLRDLHSWFGEPHDKLAKTVKEMADERLIDLVRGPANTMLIFPKGKGVRTQEVKLTPHQLKLYHILKDAYKVKQASLCTNYTRLCQCSALAIGTVKTGIQRLHDLGLIEIEQDSASGQQNKLTLRVIDTEKQHANNVVRFDQIPRGVQGRKLAAQ